MTLNLLSNTQKISWQLRCPTLLSPLIGPTVIRSNSSTTQFPLQGDWSGSPQFNTGIGGASLVNLHNQILTLKEIILSLESIIKEESNSIEGEYSIGASKESPESVTFEAQDFLKLQEEYNKLIFKKHQVWCRSFVIPKTFVGLSFQVHNGSKFVLLKITEKIVGYRFGEFVPTRKVTIHKEVKKKK